MMGLGELKVRSGRVGGCWEGGGSISDLFRGGERAKDGKG